MNGQCECVCKPDCFYHRDRCNCKDECTKVKNLQFQVVWGLNSDFRLASEGLTDKSWTVAVNVFAKKIANMSMDGVIANHPQ